MVPPSSWASTWHARSSVHPFLPPSLPPSLSLSLSLVFSLSFGPRRTATDARPRRTAAGDSLPPSLPPWLPLCHAKPRAGFFPTSRGIENFTVASPSRTRGPPRTARRRRSRRPASHSSHMRAPWHSVAARAPTTHCYTSRLARVHAIAHAAIRPSPAGVKGRQRYGLEMATDH